MLAKKKININLHILIIIIVIVVVIVVVVVSFLDLSNRRKLFLFSLGVAFLLSSHTFPNLQDAWLLYIS